MKDFQKENNLSRRTTWMPSWLAYIILIIIYLPGILFITTLVFGFLLTGPFFLLAFQGTKISGFILLFVVYFVPVFLLRRYLMSVININRENRLLSISQNDDTQDLTSISKISKKHFPVFISVLILMFVLAFIFFTYGRLLINRAALSQAAKEAIVNCDHSRRDDKYECYGEVAKNLKENLICQTISQSKGRNICFTKLLESKKDPSVCEEGWGSSDQVGANNCYVQVALSYKDPIYCGFIKSTSDLDFNLEQARSSCRAKVESLK